MTLILDRDRPVPLARQIQAHFERLIRERQLVAGVKLPATRELARDLGVNRATVALAYEELVAAGLARAHVGQGTFVAPRREGNGAARPVPRRAPAARAAIDWSALLSRSARIMAADDGYRQPTGGGAGLISFAGGMPDSALFPTDAFRRVLNQVVRDEGEELLQYYSAGGYPPLRRYISTYLLKFGVEARPEEILIVNGSQQGFDLVGRTFIDPGDFVAVEQPTYPRAMQVLRAFGAELLAVPWDAEGPRADVFQRLLARHAPKLFYCQPTGHNPNGLTMSPERARDLLAAAAEYQVPIVEDGFDGSLHYGRRPATPLKALDRDGLVIYVGTFSKVLFPGLRLGWVVAPPTVIERLEAAKQLTDLHTSALIQAAVHRFCAGRLFERHIARATREYARRRGALLAALARRMPAGVTWTEPAGGFSLLVTLPAGLDARAVLDEAVSRGVAFTPGDVFFADNADVRTLRLAFAAVPAARIDEGARRLADAIRAAQRRGPQRVVERATVPLV
ncbi:MAG: PLP-dependent aminotransferase family protein [Candidatus Rokubacteria bacterium]|nr:PLP-dependent aminotransferase family protein [Candidatus Rokubacteria bacterium]